MLTKFFRGPTRIAHISSWWCPNSTKMVPIESPDSQLSIGAIFVQFGSIYLEIWTFFVGVLNWSDLRWFERIFRFRSNQIKSNHPIFKTAQIKSNQITPVSKTAQIKSNQIIDPLKTAQIKSNRDLIWAKSLKSLKFINYLYWKLKMVISRAGDVHFGRFLHFFDRSRRDLSIYDQISNRPYLELVMSKFDENGTDRKPWLSAFHRCHFRQIWMHVSRDMEAFSGCLQLTVIWGDLSGICDFAQIK